MRYRLRHELKFTYTKPVFLEPHIFYLCPRSDGAQRLLEFSLKVDPQPEGMNALLDLEGNTAHRVWFTSEAAALTVSADSLVETHRDNPFDYLADASFGALPKPYPKALAASLKPYTAWTPLASIKAYTAPVVKAARQNPLNFLFQLTMKFNADFKKTRREDGAPWSPGKTLSMRVGSCRDLAVLFAACCRAQGLAARFVSGYYEADTAIPEKDLHAWVEVYIPGAGWRGYDPLNGLATGEQHVTLAAALDPSAVAPLTGHFRGTGVDAALSYSVQLVRDLPQPQLTVAG